MSSSSRSLTIPLFIAIATIASILDTDIVSMSSILHPNKVAEPGQLWHLRRLLSLAGAEVIVQGGEFHHTWNSNPLGGASEEPEFSSETSGSRSSLAFFQLSSSSTGSTPRTSKKKNIDKRDSRSVPPHTLNSNSKSSSAP